MFMIILLASISNVYGETTTVWGPGEEYKVTFLHSGKITEENNLVLQFENLPVTEFEVQNYTNEGYNYNYLGYGNISYVKLVEMAELQVNDQLTDETIDYPTGGFPILLPIEYKAKTSWIEEFAGKISTFEGSFNDMYFFLHSNATISSKYVEFRSTINASLSFLETNIVSPLQFISNSRFEGYNLTSSIITIDYSYTKTTGALFYYNYTIIGNQDLTGVKVKISEQLDFVAIIPPINAFFRIGMNSNSLIFSILIMVSIKRKKQ